MYTVSNNPKNNIAPNVIIEKSTILFDNESFNSREVSSFLIILVNSLNK